MTYIQNQKLITNQAKTTKKIHRQNIIHRLFLIAAAFQFSLNSGVIVTAQDLKPKTCLNSDLSCNNQDTFNPNSPTTYDTLMIPYLVGDHYPCNDLEKFILNQPQPTIQLSAYRPRQIAVITDCNLPNYPEITRFHDFVQDIRHMLHQIKLTQPNAHDLIETLRETFEFIVANKDKKGSKYILIDLIKYKQLMQCEDQQQTCIISDVDNSMPQQLHFSNPKRLFHLGNSDSPEFMVSQKSNLNLGQSAILFSLARAVPYLKIKSLHHDLSFKKAAIDSTGHVLSILHSIQSEKPFDSDSFGPMIYDKTLLNNIRQTVSKVLTFRRSGPKSSNLNEAHARYKKENEGAMMFMNNAGVNTLKLLASEQGINWDESNYIQIATQYIDLLAALFDSTISKKSLEFG
tara:strand:+ start:399 stop:1604 length:1206 start_codon:yes stop_codon:yes gene_type:complete